MQDDEFESPETSEVNDTNTYVFGRIGGHSVMIGCLPGGRYSISSAATVAKDMVRSFPSLSREVTVHYGIIASAPRRRRRDQLYKEALRP
jgi:hypothetical protein